VLRSLKVVLAAVAGAIVFMGAEARARMPHRADHSDNNWFYERAQQDYNAKQFVHARVMLERCTGAFPKFAPCHKLLGLTFGKLGEAASGARELQRFLELAPTDPDATQVRGQIAALLEWELTRD
jgi:hypothetical protein